MPKVNMWVYYTSLCLVFEMTFAVSNVVLSTLFSKIIGPRRQVWKSFRTSWLGQANLTEEKFKKFNGDLGHYAGNFPNVRFSCTNGGASYLEVSLLIFLREK